MQIIFDASDLARIDRLLGRLPDEIRRTAFRRGMARAKKAVERDYVSYASKVLKVQQAVIRKRVRIHDFSDGSMTLTVRSKNILLHELGAQQREYGVHVRGRGRYEEAFIVKQGQKRRKSFEMAKTQGVGLVMQRLGKSRLPVEALFGPNPANAINRRPEGYQQLLNNIAMGEFSKTVLQQVEYLLGRS